jgi:hypothetical protein
MQEKGCSGYKNPEPLQLGYQLFHTPSHPNHEVRSRLLIGLCFANSSSLSALVLHKNGALVPEDTPEVSAARELHLEALASVSEDGEVTASEEGFLLLTEEEARQLGISLNIPGVGGIRGSYGRGGLRVGGHIGGFRFGGGRRG